MHKSSQLDTTLPCHTEVVPSWHDFSHVIIVFFNSIVYLLGHKCRYLKGPSIQFAQYFKGL